MKGLILAGGFATRLRPLSCSKPKLLFPVVGVPLLDRMISWMKDAGIEEVILAVNHLSERLRLEVGDKRLGVKIHVSVEKEPLGTGGPIKLASRLLGSEDFVVVNGDIVSNIDLDSMVRTHLARSALATIALVEVSNPKRFGSVSIDSDERVVRFEEKSPALSKRTLINAGVYVFNERAMEHIPSTGPVSLEKTVFPKFVDKGSLWGRRHRGFWYDIGRIPDYVRTNIDLLRSRVLETHRDKIPSRRFDGSTTVVPPSHIGKSVRLGHGTRIGPNAILSDGIMVGDGATVTDSIVFEDTVIGEGCRVNGALIGERVVIGKHCKVARGAIVAGQISLPDGSVIKKDAVVLA